MSLESIPVGAAIHTVFDLSKADQFTLTVSDDNPNSTEAKEMLSATCTKKKQVPTRAPCKS